VTHTSPDPEPLDSKERDLGLDVPITRRDFLNSTLLASGALLLDARAPLHQQTPSTTNPAWEGFGGVGDYSRSHGNMWAAVSTAHDLRDGKLTGDAARRRGVDTGERYDLVVVGGGLSGLGAAAFFQKLRGGRVLVLDNHAMIGGEAKRNEFVVDGVHLIGP
jgi:spermidine dehydrogenase